MEQATELCLFVKYTIQLYLPLIKDLSDEEQHQFNINIDHPDFEEWLEIREPKGDINRQSLNLHQCAVIGDKFMRRLTNGDVEARKKWGKLLQKRKATGEPYILFKGNTNKQNPPAYKDNALKVHMTNICSENCFYTQMKIIHSFVVYLV